MKPEEMFLWILVLGQQTMTTFAGFGNPHEAYAILEQSQGKPCECRGGYIAAAVGDKILSSVDCSSHMAYQTLKSGHQGPVEWKCVHKPKLIPTVNGLPGPCPCTSFYQSMHASCYTRVQQCTGNDNKTYFTAILIRQYGGATGGDWSVVPAIGGSTNLPLMQSPCHGTVGQPVCWNRVPPVYISDGGGPQDQIREVLVQKKIETLMEAMFPKLNYHPLALPKSKSNMNLDAQSFDILEATYKLLNESNPTLAQECWLCMRQGQPIPLALPTLSISYEENGTCVLIPPLQVQPLYFSNSSCLFSPSDNDTAFEIDLGVVSFTQCSETINVSSPLCAVNKTVFVCGSNRAYTQLPVNWTGLCVMATLLPDVDVIPGDEPVPVPTIDRIAGRTKRAVQFIPLLVGLRVTTALASGTAGLGVSITQYNKLSKQLFSDVQTLSSTIQDLQDQVDSLAEVVLQNRKGLDLLTAEKGHICLALQEKCCFYANKSGIVRDKIKNLQEDLERRRKELIDNPFWTGLNGILPYLLPLLGPLFGLLILLSLGPFLFNKLMTFVKRQIDAIKMQPLQVHYHRLDMADNSCLELNRVVNDG